MKHYENPAALGGEQLEVMAVAGLGELALAQEVPAFYPSEGQHGEMGRFVSEFPSASVGDGHTNNTGQPVGTGSSSVGGTTQPTTR